MDAASAIREYGYAALVIGTFFEGEAVLAFGGFAAHQGHLRFAWVMFFGALGVFCSDQFCFFLGRYFGQWVLRRFPAMHQRVATALKFLERYPNWFIVGFQFIPGASTVTPIALGISKVSLCRFLALDVLGVAVWTVAFASAGYVFGAALSYVIQDLRRYDTWFIAVFALALILLWRWRNRR